MASGNNIDTAQETYTGFTHLIKWGAISAGIAAVIVVFLIS